MRIVHWRLPLKAHVPQLKGDMALGIPTPRHRGLTRPYRLLLEAAGRCANMLGADLAPAALLACEGCRNACTKLAAVLCCFPPQGSAQEDVHGPP